jgi:hypothetical protein
MLRICIDIYCFSERANMLCFSITQGERERERELQLLYEHRNGAMASKFAELNNHMSKCSSGAKTTFFVFCPSSVTI